MRQINQHFQLLIVLFSFGSLKAQDCSSSLDIVLKNINGGVYANQQVTLTNKADGKTYSEKSNSSGTASFVLPCNTLFDLTIANYTQKREMQSPKNEGGKSTRTFSYEPDMAAKEKLFQMSPAEKSAVDNFANTIPDSLIMVSARMNRPSNLEFLTELKIGITDINNNALPEEQVTIVGEKRKKKIKGTTDKNGNLFVYLAKGDKYLISFKYHKDYTSKEFDYTKGIAEAEMSFSYLGTKEIERRKKIEAERIAAEEKRLKEELLAFEKKCKKLGITVEEGRKRELEEMSRTGNSGTEDTVVSAVLNRNKWSEKLIVCDLTGSMSPYAAQLSLWYRLTYMKEKNLQFVFFNDGDEMPDDRKKIGSTGGIYYAASKGIDSLSRTVAYVSSRGSGGDCPENNMEALIKAVKIAKPYKELVMIADNNAPVKDIKLLKDFKNPVHIILCGVNDYYVLEDYLNIAWKTKGSIHTIEDDITNLATMLEGQEIKIGKNIYKIMGGEFVRITKI